MISPDQLYKALQRRGIDFFAGVPDSLLKDFCAYVTDHTDPSRNIITANEGGAIALAGGYYMATGKPALVYMQNSGLGNIINPMTSLADPDVYGLPMLLVIGWRGEPGKKDEPQHVKMGRVTCGLLEAIEVEYAVLPDSIEAVQDTLEHAMSVMTEGNRPFALVVRKGTFEKYKLNADSAVQHELTREAAIAVFAEVIGTDVPIVSTTGKPSRELFETRELRGESHNTDFLTVGSMGHSSQIALGAALAQPERDVYCLDGDGALIMHMGGIASIGALGLKNYKHVVLNNGAHDSVGGQPTVGFDIDICAIARACGYKTATCVDSEADLRAALVGLKEGVGPAMVEVRVSKGARADLGRPTMTPRDLKAAWMGNFK